MLMDTPITHLSLFSGIGGIDLAAEWAGFHTVGFCEQNSFCQQVLNKHWPDVPIWSDVRDVTKESFYEKTGLQSVTLLTGGVPCQPASVAGKRRGTDDARWLWPEALRVLREIRPEWAVFENPTGILTLENGLVFESLLTEMEGTGYEVQAFIVPACAVNAKHRRDRCFIVAHSESKQNRRLQQRGVPANIGASSKTVSNSRCAGCEELHTTAQPGWAGFGTGGGHADVPDTEGIIKGKLSERAAEKYSGFSSGSEDVCYPAIKGLPDWAGGTVGQPFPITELERPDGREVERDFRGVAHGVSRRVDRLRALGNAVVPEQVYPVLAGIAEIERRFNP